MKWYRRTFCVTILFMLFLSAYAINTDEILYPEKQQSNNGIIEASKELKSYSVEEYNKKYNANYNPNKSNEKPKQELVIILLLVLIGYLLYRLAKKKDCDNSEKSK